MPAPADIGAMLRCHRDMQWCASRLKSTLGFRHGLRLGHAAPVAMLEGTDARNPERRRLVRRPAREVKPTKFWLSSSVRESSLHAGGPNHGSGKAGVVGTASRQGAKSCWLKSWPRPLPPSQRRGQGASAVRRTRGTDRLADLDAEDPRARLLPAGRRRERSRSRPRWPAQTRRSRFRRHRLRNSRPSDRRIRRRVSCFAESLTTGPRSVLNGLGLPNNAAREFRAVWQRNGRASAVSST